MVGLEGEVSVEMIMGRTGQCNINCDKNPHLDRAGRGGEGLSCLSVVSIVSYNARPDRLRVYGNAVSSGRARELAGGL